MSTGIKRITAERAKQVAKGRTAETDAADNTPKEMFLMIEAFLYYANASIEGSHDPTNTGLHYWPWSAVSFKPKDIDTALTKAGALIAALIDAREVVK